MTGLLHEPLTIIDPATEQLVTDLQRTREIIEKGWCKGAYYDDDDNHCLVGAVYTATSVKRGDATYPVPKVERTQAAIDFLRPLVPNGELTLWNDKSYRTKEEVLAKIDEAIALAQARG